MLKMNMWKLGTKVCTVYHRYRSHFFCSIPNAKTYNIKNKHFTSGTYFSAQYFNG